MTALRSGEDQRPGAAGGEMIIRDARPADLPSIIEIYNAAIATRTATAQLDPVTLEGRKDWLGEHSPDQFPFWIGQIEEQVVGWLTLKTFLPRRAYRGTAEVSVYVHDRFRRQGVARRLLEEAIKRGPALSLSAFVGLVFAHNEPSIQLFEKLGFTRWGLLPRIARVEEIARDLTIMGRHV